MLSNVSDVKQQLKAFIVNTYLMGDKSVRLKDDESFRDANIIDSTGVLELVSFLEETYEIRVEDAELVPENFDSIDNLAQYLRGKFTHAS